MFVMVCVQVREQNEELHQMRVRKCQVESELSELRARHNTEAEEWRQFQKDLQVAVVIADKFRAETTESMLRVSEENMHLREKSLDQQLELDHLRFELQSLRAARSSVLSGAELKAKVPCGWGSNSVC